MNKVIASPAPPPCTQFEKGDILKDKNGESLHLLCFFIDDSGNQWWVAMSLTEGHYWSRPQATANDAAKGLTLYKRDATLTIS